VQITRSDLNSRPEIKGYCVSAGHSAAAALTTATAATAATSTIALSI
jgi:hypothetical protein